MHSRDTSPKAAQIQERIHDAMGPEGRFELALRMSELAREFAKAGIREKHPGWTDGDIIQELTYIFYGQRR